MNDRSINGGVSRDKALGAAIGLTAIGAVAGLALWAVQLSGGMIQTGMRDLDSWGLYITAFMFFVGLSAGGLIISSVPKVLGIKGFGGISKIAIWSAVCSTIVAVSLVVVDLGNPLRLWELFVRPNFTSPLMWDICVISTYFLVSVAYLVLTLRHEQGLVGDLAMRVLSSFALVIAIGVHTVTAWIFALNNSHEFWNTALMGPWFVSSALVCGTALVLIIVCALRRLGYMPYDQAHVVRMGKWLAAFVLVDLYFFACDLLTTWYSAGEAGRGIVLALLAGPIAPFFWIQVIGCSVAAAICLVPALRSTPSLVTASALCLIGVFCKRCQIMLGGFQFPNLDLPLALGGHSATFADAGTAQLAQAYAGAVYWPTPLEFGVLGGMVSLALCVFLFGFRALDLSPEGEALPVEGEAR